jgi:protein-L-isoaspartate(D-aspartate) O-methyltransferase
MAAASRTGPGDNVLEIGTGCGYAAAVMSRLCSAIYTIELSHTLADRARQRLSAFAYHNVVVYEGDGTRGLIEAAPFDAILVEAGARDIPSVLLDQLKVNGRLIIPLGNLPDGTYDLTRITRQSADRYTHEVLGTVRMDPLIGWEHAIPMPPGDPDVS